MGLSNEDPRSVASWLLSKFDFFGLETILAALLEAHPGLRHSLADKAAVEEQERYSAELTAAICSHNVKRVSQVLESLSASRVDDVQTLRILDASGASLLHLCLRGLPETASAMIQLLIMRKSSIDVRNAQGETPLLFAVRSAALHCANTVSSTAMKLVQELILARADPSVADSMGETPLMEAVWSLELCRLLLESRADVHQTSNSNLTAADFAKNDTEILALLANGARGAEQTADAGPIACKFSARERETESDMSTATPEADTSSSELNPERGGDGKTPSVSSSAPGPLKGQTRWTCCRCDEVNRADRTRCNNCGEIRDEAPSRQRYCAAELNSGPQEVCFFGIIDAKYDRRQHRGKGLRILELGNGKQSRFSGYGESILTAFQRDYRLAGQLERSALVDNKKLTHDVFLECGFGHLRPKQVCYPRVYRPDLAEEIARRLECNGSVPVVLKLLNRCRGAGVMVVNIGEELDEMLRLLLTAPSDDAFSEPSLEVATASDPSSLEEQCWHWWSNECPVFVAERCECSHSVHLGGQDYDATLRIGFVLVRGNRPDGEGLRVQCLGGYWKLPAGAAKSGADLRDRVVSKASSGTAPVSNEDYSDVCSILEEALPAVFARERSDVSTSMRRYADSPALFAFIVSRQAGEKCRGEVQEHRKVGKSGAGTASGAAETSQASTTSRLFEIAEEKLVGNSKSLEDAWQELRVQALPTRAAASYLERQRGAAYARGNNWEAAQAHFERSLELHQWNAAALFLLGVCHLRVRSYEQAQKAFLKSLHIDPEFKAAYVNYGFCAMALGEWDNAILANKTGLSRHPKAHQCSYNLGVSLTRQLVSRLKCGGQVEELEAMTEACALELQKARDQKEVAKSEWSAQDDGLLSALDTTLRDLRSGTPPWGLWSQLNWALHGAKGWTFMNYRL